MFAMVLLTIVVFGVLKLQTSNLTSSNTNKNEIQAYFYANQGMEIVEALGYGELCTPPVDSFCIRFVDQGATYGLNTSNSGDPIPEPFSRTLKIEDIGLPDAYKVTSIIEWTDSTGKHNQADGGAVTSSRIIYN
ncbi:hypothetical protein JW758_01240 [Candidatus Peregrinibacteria bacterium]|nr:hypothetical protein [Candidatus Peregrinibacteria bacterium]